MTFSSSSESLVSFHMKLLVRLDDLLTPFVFNLHTVVGDNINIMKTTFELNFDFYQAFKQHGYTKIWKQREASL